MKSRHVLALLMILGMTGVSNAAMRTFTITQGGTSGGRSISPVGTLNFSYIDGAFSSGNQVAPGELTGGFSLSHSSFPGQTFTLNRIVQSINSKYTFYFPRTDVVDNSELRIAFDGPAFVQPGGTDLPDGVEGNAFTQYFVNNVVNSAYSTNPSITIGTAAVPEPSAFGFGALALAATGLGRWTRKRFFTA